MPPRQLHDKCVARVLRRANSKSDHYWQRNEDTEFCLQKSDAVLSGSDRQIMKLRLACILAGLALSTFATAAQEKTAYSIDHGKSKLEIKVYKAGLLKAFGHDHLVSAGEISGRVEFDAQKIENSSVIAKVVAKSLSVSDPGESDKNRTEIQTTMTGPQVLDAAKFPAITFSSTSVSVVKTTADGWELTVAGKLNLHGVEKPISLPLQFHVESDQLVALGEVFLLQTEYGITPVSVAGGSVKVKDKLRIGFTIVAIKMKS
jgi:polyisoprenoid-binding protein YceI